MAGVFDDALEKRYQLSPEIVLADVDGTDVFLIHNAQTGTVLRISASTLASFINAAVSQADILEALDAPYGVATLGSDSKVPAAQLPSYVDDVLEFANYAALPSTGESGKIYVLATPYTSGGVTSSQFRWSGSAYSPIIASPGSTDAVTEGSVNLYHTTARAAAAAPVQSVAGRTGAVTLSKGDVGLSNVDNTSDANKPVSTAQQTALDTKAPKADPVFTGGSITLPVGTTGERPSGGSGKLRMNSTTSLPEWFDPVAQTWVSFNATEYEVEYFVLGGGGGGGGAQGGAGSSNYTGGTGGSGVVIVRYAGSQRGTGGTVTSAGGYTYHTLSSSGTFTA